MATKTRGKAGLAVGFDNDENKNVFGAMYWLANNAASKEMITAVLQNMGSRSWQIENYQASFRKHHQEWAEFRKTHPDIVVITGNKSANHHTNGYGSKVYGYTVDCFAVSGMTKEESRQQNRFHRLDRETQQIPMESFIGLSYDALSKRFAHRIYTESFPKFDYNPSDFNFDDLVEEAKNLEISKNASNQLIRSARNVTNNIRRIQDVKSNRQGMEWFEPEHIRAYVLEKQEEARAWITSAQEQFHQGMETLDGNLEDLDGVGGVIHPDYLSNRTHINDDGEHITVKSMIDTLRIDRDDYTDESWLAIQGLLELLASKSKGPKLVLDNEEVIE